MRWHKTLARILPILSIVNFVLAVPVAVRNTHELRVDAVNATEDGTASASQKRYDPWDDQSSTNAADEPETNAPPSPESSDWDKYLRASESPPPSSESDWDRWLEGSLQNSWLSDSSIGSNSALAPPSSPGSPDSSTGSYGGSMPVGDSHPLSPDPINPQVQAPPASPLSPESSTGHQLTPPPSPEPDARPPPSPELEHPAEPESKSFFSGLLKGKIKRRISGSGAVNAAQRVLQGCP
jgi:hypothetical protein